MEMDIEAYLRRCYQNQIADVQIVQKEDLDLKNHLSGLSKSYLKLSFVNVQQLMNVKSDLLHIVERNHTKFDAAEAYESILIGKREQRTQDFLNCIVDLREYDVPYHVRFAIDNGDLHYILLLSGHFCFLYFLKFIPFQISCHSDVR